jgi:predicted membrane chloride channel (bestrophin family)
VTTRRISGTVSALFVFSAAVDSYAKLAASDPNLPEFVLPLTPFELTAPVLGLLLVFRTNTAYERFNRGSDASWEVTGRFRSVVRQLVMYSAAPSVPEKEREVIDLPARFHLHPPPPNHPAPCHAL